MSLSEIIQNSSARIERLEIEVDSLTRQEKKALSTYNMAKNAGAELDDMRLELESKRMDLECQRWSSIRELGSERLRLRSLLTLNFRVSN